jgi:hypothetical protein
MNFSSSYILPYKSDLHPTARSSTKNISQSATVPCACSPSYSICGDVVKNGSKPAQEKSL